MRVKKKNWMSGHVIPFLFLALFSLILITFGTAAGPKPGDTATPIKYVVVIFQENNSFDHYFGTYPVATNPGGEPVFTALPNTPSINGITPLLNNLSGVAPFRLDRSQAVTCDNTNAYNAEQSAYNSGLVNLFPANASQATGPPTPCITDLIMGYYDGNTVTALWNY